MTEQGMKIHSGTCKWKDEYEVESIIGHRGPVVMRWYKIRWKGFTEEYDTYEPRVNVHPDLIRDYEIDNDVYVHDWKYRCDVCDLPYSSERGIIIHRRKNIRPKRIKTTLTDSPIV